MAKRKKKEEEEGDDIPFKFPEFDRKEFILKEMLQARILFAVTGLALVLGILAFFLTLQLNNAIIGLLVGIGGFFPIRNIAEKMGDTGSLEKKDWLGHYAIYFFTFLAVWVLLFNYPITDVSHPEIGGVAVYVMHQNITANSSVTEWVPVAPGADIPAGSNISIRANVTDNGELSRVTSTISDNDGHAVDTLAMTQIDSTGTFQCTPELPHGHYTFTITAEDSAGNTFTTEAYELSIGA